MELLRLNAVSTTGAACALSCIRCSELLLGRRVVFDLVLEERDERLLLVGNGECRSKLCELGIAFRDMLEGRIGRVRCDVRWAANGKSSLNMKASSKASSCASTNLSIVLFRLEATEALP